MKTSENTSDFMKLLRQELAHLPEDQRADLLQELETHIEDGLLDPKNGITLEAREACLHTKLGTVSDFVQYLPISSTSMVLKALSWFVMPIIWICIATLGYYSLEPIWGSYFESPNEKSGFPFGFPAAYTWAWLAIKISGLAWGSYLVSQKKYPILLRNWWYSCTIYYVLSGLHNLIIGELINDPQPDYAYIASIIVGLLSLILARIWFRKIFTFQMDGILFAITFLPICTFLPIQLLTHEDTWGHAFFWGFYEMCGITVTAFVLWGIAIFGISNRSKQWRYLICGWLFFVCSVLFFWIEHLPSWHILALSLQFSIISIIIGFIQDFRNGKLHRITRLRHIAT